MSIRLATRARPPVFNSIMPTAGRYSRSFGVILLADRAGAYGPQ
jgi:hypothetical protein